MEPLYATVLDNWFPDTNDLRVRKGYEEHVTGVTGYVESLMVYNEPDGTQTLFAAANSAFYDVTSSGSLGGAVQSSLSNNRWNYTNFTNSSGTSYLCCFNGVDAPRYWNGSSWITITGASSPAITGVTTTNLKYPFTHKRRIFLIEKDSLKLWYLPIDAVGGAANAFDLSGIADIGGYLVAGGTWTIDGGAGIDDYLVAITSEGQVIVYSGVDPSSDYKLVGVWNLGEPLGQRPVIKYRGDVLLVLSEGVYPLSSVLQGSMIDPKNAITFNIQPTFRKAAVSNAANYGWQVIHYPQQNMLIVNIPKDNPVQYVMNTVTGAWCQFSGIDSKCWAVMNGSIYFGGNGIVGKFWSTESDNGENITADVRHAFNYMGALGKIKRVSAMRPNLLSDGRPTISVGVNTDYQDQNLTGTLNFTEQNYGVWGTGKWGSMTWGGALNFLGGWSSTTGVGVAIAPRIKLATSGIEVRYEAVDINFEVGTTIG